MEIETESIHGRRKKTKNEESDKAGTDRGAVLLHSVHQTMIGKTVHGFPGTDDQMIQQVDIHKRAHQKQSPGQLLVLARGLKAA